MNPNVSRLTRSFWQQDAEAGDSPDAAPLDRDTRTEVAIVGGGYVGLWTAYWLKRAAPHTDVVLIDQGRCGDGASGRNGGFALSWWTKLPTLIRLLGTEEALAVCQQSEDAISDIGHFCDEHDVNAQFVRGGWFWTARARAHVTSWDGLLAACDRLGVSPLERIPDEAVAQRTGSATHLSGVFGAAAATVQPYLLARGLRDVCLKLGVRIYEHTRMVALHRGQPARLHTPAGVITADKVVIATNAWAASLRELRTRMVVVSSDMVVTPPIPERLAEIGWTGGEAVNDSQLFIDYYRTTQDGRIAFGKGVAELVFGGRVEALAKRERQRAGAVEADFRAAFPSLADIPLPLAWSGAVDRSPTGVPELGRLGGHRNIFYGVGWSGNGVAPSVLGGRILASLTAELDDPWARHPLVDRRVGMFPPEPLRFFGGQLVRAAAYEKDSALMQNKQPNAVTALISRLVPSGVEDH